MTFEDLLRKTRSYRRFHQHEKVDMATLRSVIGNVRLAASPANLQPLKFVLINDEDTNDVIFPNLKWAGYLPQWPGPEPGEQPAAYIIMLGDPSKSGYIAWDYGIALQTIMLSLTERGLGGCAIAACDKPSIIKQLDIPSQLELAAVIAVGKPCETVVIDPVQDDNIKYWRDEKQVHHVPKREVDDLLYKCIGK
jgi:nitroreductase